MNLRGPESGIFWKEYWNQTPTFELTPIEKPDLSPFLIHMTGKNSLIHILKGENSPEEITVEANSGYLKSVIPSFDEQAGYYNSEVVCFTEAPIFALDFFRYRSFRRWENDQRFGIGFSKADLIKHRNVRPVVYLDDETNSNLLSLCNNILNDNLSIVNSDGEVIDYKPTFESVKPLLFPMLENTKLQGFMWEREWRYPFNDGLVFPFEAIKVICCPADEKAEIEEILSTYKNQIQIVESWREYDDVTNYLKRREREINSDALTKISKIKNLSVLTEFKIQNERTINMLSAHYQVFKETTEGLEKNNISEMIAEMKTKTVEIVKRIKELQEEHR